MASSSGAPSAGSASTAAAAALLGRQLKQMQTDKSIRGISCGLVNDSNMFEWEVMLMLDDDSKYYGGIDPHLLASAFKASRITLLNPALCGTPIRRQLPCAPLVPTRLPPVPAHPHVPGARDSLPSQCV